MLALPNITSFSISSWSTYLTLDLDGTSVTLVQRPDGKTEAYTYVKGMRFETPSYLVPNDLLTVTVG